MAAGLSRRLVVVMGWMLATELLLTASTGVAAGEVMKLAAAANTVDTVISEVILREAYRRLGVSAEIEKFPAERALRLANAGKVDGDVQRIDGLSRKYPNLLQITPAINFIEGAAFSAEKKFAVSGWTSLKPYRIGIIRGIKFAEAGTTGMNRYTAGDYGELFRMLARGRVDVVIAPSLNGHYQIEWMRLKEIEELEPPLKRFPLFHYLHRKHEVLANRLGEMFMQMRDTGELGKIRTGVVSILLKRAMLRLPLCDDDYRCFEPALGS